MGKRGQVAMEYMVVVAFVMMITLPLIILFQQSSNSFRDDITAGHLQSVGQKIIDAALSVSYLGAPSTTTLRVYMPEGVYNASIGSREIVYTVQKDSGYDSIVLVSPVNISGTLPVNQGIKLIKVEARTGYVWISSD